MRGQLAHSNTLPIGLGSVVVRARAPLHFIVATSLSIQLGLTGADFSNVVDEKEKNN